ncbi:hypothetical protein M5K25_022122 [Dendrobium thyrsiflorum]|uniref:Uncharacterized protein n=1 Tax=Dendrobium thyrsiflorum TaxID=117978 RepID=A0ABD0UBK7_DENTH
MEWDFGRYLTHEGLPEHPSSLLLVHKISFKTAQDRAYSSSDSSETEAEEETTNLYLMARDDVRELTYEQLFYISEKIHSSYKKLKKVHASLKLEFTNLEKEHETLRKEHYTVDSDYMKLLDEFNSLNAKHENLNSKHETLLKKYSDLFSEHDILKSLHVELETAFKELDAIACDMHSSEHALKFEIANSKATIQFGSLEFFAATEMAAAAPIHGITIQGHATRNNSIETYA